MQHHLRKLAVVVVISVVACGGDSTAPSAPARLSAREALQSLTRGLTSLNQSPASSSTALTLGILPPIADSQAVLVGQITASIDGSPVPMFAIAQRVVYPHGNCFEQLITGSNFTNSGSCTGLPGGLSMILWQTSSAAQAPDRVIVVLADTGTSSFADLFSIDASFTTGGSFPAFALYLERGGALWATSSGSLTSTVVATGQSCTTILPLFATSATCSVGSFSESGSLTFSLFDPGAPTATGTHTVAISAQGLGGIIQTVSATAPITLPTN